MTLTLVIPGDVEAEIRAHAALSVETGAVLIARQVSVGKGDLRLLARDIRWVPQDAYLRRSRTSMSIASEGYVDALGAADDDNAIALWFHTHPVGSQPLPSDMDRAVDAEITELFQLRSGSNAYGTVIAALNDGHLMMSGRLQCEGGDSQSIDRFWLVGDRWALLPAYDAAQPEIASMFDRNVRAFGAAIQRTLGSLAVAIVGSGGTGSAVAEQLTRLGVRDMILVDADTLSLSNVTRVYGSTPGDIGRAKVEILADHLRSFAPDMACETIEGMITLKTVAARLRRADLIFGCTDDNAGRLVLSRLSTYFLIPVIDLGILISSGDDGVLTGIDGRVTILSPGTACLVCRDRIDTARAAAELLTPDERTRLAHEGYAPALGQTEPAVVAFTTAVAAAATNELLERLIGYGPEDRPSEIILRMHEREISGNRAGPRPLHYCARPNGKWGAGDEEPFLGQLWPDS